MAILASPHITQEVPVSKRGETETSAKKKLKELAKKDYDDLTITEKQGLLKKLQVEWSNRQKEGASKDKKKRTNLTKGGKQANQMSSQVELSIKENKKDINNLNDWWYSNEVQHARKIFCDQFANLTNENYKKLEGPRTRDGYFLGIGLMELP